MEFITQKYFSRAVKIDIIKVLDSLVFNKDLSLHQFDVKNANLHGKNEEVCMEAPPGFSQNFWKCQGFKAMI